MEGVILDDQFLTEEEIDILSNWGTIPLFLHSSGNSYKKGREYAYDSINLHHTLVPRRDDGGGDPFEVTSSLYYDVLLPILDRFCATAGVEYSEVLRCAINITFPTNSKYIVDPHTDHAVPHHLLIIYLNASDGNTVFFKRKTLDQTLLKSEDLEEEGVLLEIPPVRGRIVAIEDGSTVHTAKPCTEGYRAVLVTTFR